MKANPYLVAALRDLIGDPFFWVTCALAAVFGALFGFLIA